MNKFERVKIAIPGGELQSGVLNRLQQNGLDVDRVDERRYFLPTKSLPIDLIILRASDVPNDVVDKRSTIKAGITGSDILWESGFGRNAGQLLPITSGSTLFLGVTQVLREFVKKTERREPEKTDLSGSMVVTKFPNIASEVLQNIDDIEIVYAPGKTESKQYVYPNCNGIIDVFGKGLTIAANSLNIIEKVLEPVTIRMITAGEKLTERDEEILFDFRNQLTQGAEI